MRRYGLIFPDMVDQDGFRQEEYVQQSDLNFDKFHEMFENTFEEVMVFHDSILFNIISSTIYKFDQKLTFTENPKLRRLGDINMSIP